jgi:hypothetical protein
VNDHDPAAVVAEVPEGDSKKQNRKCLELYWRANSQGCQASEAGEGAVVNGCDRVDSEVPEEEFVRQLRELKCALTGMSNW